MTTDIIITGIGSPIPSATDAGPGVLVRHRDSAGHETHLQFDAGRATLMRLVAADSGPGNLDALFLTHHHSDHCTGLEDIILTRWVMDRQDTYGPLTVVAPDGPAADFARQALSGWEDDLAVRRQHSGRTTIAGVDVRAFRYPDGVEEVWSANGVKVLAGQVRHEPVHPAVGYRIETPDGAVAISGDTRVCDEVADLADGVEVLVYEAMRFSAFDDMPRRRTFILDYHADTIAIGRQAAEIGVPTLVLTHLIPAPKRDTDRQLFVDDIRAGGYQGEVIVAKDLSSVRLGERS